MALKFLRKAAAPLRIAYALLVGALGVWTAWLGVLLLGAGGSPYFAGLGLALLGTALLAARRDDRAAALFALILAATLGWSLYEVGLDPLALAPRLGLLTALGLPLLATRRPRWLGAATTAVAVTLLIATLAAARPDPSPPPESIRPAKATAFSGADWTSWGGDAGGSRFSTLQQIDRGNVAGLTPAWIYHTGATGGALPLTFEATPLAVGGRLFFCTGQDDVVALDGETGRRLWQFDARLDRTGVLIGTCRGVAYMRAAPGSGPCAERIYVGTMDARLIALDASNGRPCADFGDHGSVDLRTGMGGVEPGYYGVTSAPQVIRDRVVVGGWVTDGQHTAEPPGVVRAFDGRSGRLAWAFDMGAPDRHGAPAANGHYIRGTPNSWAPMSADERLGLIYIPTGNATPDYFGGERTANDDRFSSAVVALDASTGAVRWTFQTTHHDLWDYDVTAQPTLLDWPVGNGTVPALVQATKRGQLFVLDRRTGQPLTAVSEQAAPASHIAGEHAAPTQPFSTGMPSLAGPALHEADMWGLTPIDQAWCRLAFRRARYDGPLTPPGLDRPSFVYPGYGGGVEWGGVSIDPLRRILVVNTNRVADTVRLLTRAEAGRRGITRLTTHSHEGAAGAVAQEGVPYAAELRPFLSPLGVPCQRPPWGMISAIDLASHRMLWNHPFGTGRDSGPLGMASGIPLTLGVPNTGGAVVTAGGLTFIGASHDRYLRAFDTATGRELARFRLPAGGQATPMTYLGPRSGRQFVVIAAGGNPGLGTKTGDYVMAYALPATAR